MQSLFDRAREVKFTKGYQYGFYFLQNIDLNNSNSLAFSHFILVILNYKLKFLILFNYNLSVKLKIEMN
ncbi:hypothetical protein BAMA_21025 [Bacillus manliponensis]|uniref:Uncharacterized protein n=1 Tax=Bacillus manliponensis TaxID=574376 RepID=A0A073KBP4_9BACI|nr:hypothetical protein BAMA_21025 [Bacillus manliponensis]